MERELLARIIGCTPPVSESWRNIGDKGNQQADYSYGSDSITFTVEFDCDYNIMMIRTAFGTILY